LRTFHRRANALTGRGAVRFLLSLLFVFFGAVGSAFASPGCDAINAGALDIIRNSAGGTLDESTGTIAFEANEVITLSFSRDATTSITRIELFSTPAINDQSISPPGTSETMSLTIPADGNYDVSSLMGETGLPPISASLTVVCVAPLQSTSTSLASSINPSDAGDAVTFTATVTAAGGGTPTGNVVFSIDGVAQPGVALAGGVAAVTTSTLTSGTHQIVAAYAGDAGFSPSTSTPLNQVVNDGAPVSTATTLSSSKNPSSAGEAVTFNATVTAETGTATGTVAFLDGGVEIGNAALAGGGASFTTASLAAGSHAITARYEPAGDFAASTSAALNQIVGTADSTNLYLMAAKATKIAAQTSGQAMQGAVDSALDDAFGDGNSFAPGPNGFYLSYAGGSLPTAKPLEAAAFERRTASDGDKAIAGMLGTSATHSADNLQPAVSSNWRIWIDVRNTWWNSNLATGDVRGSQLNMLVGATYVFTPALAAGVFAGYETFGYESAPLNAQLDGSGWTGGAYLGWKFAPHYRFDIGIAGTALDYDAAAGIAQGGFDGSRVFLTAGVTGSHQMGAFKVSPSAKLYALWEKDEAFSDTLGAAHAERSFSTARASGGVKVAYPFQANGFALEPYVGAYADYYFSSEDTPGLNGLLVDVIRDGWSARFTGGLTLVSESGLRATFGGEFGGLGVGGAPHGSIRANLAIPLN